MKKVYIVAAIGGLAALMSIVASQLQTRWYIGALERYAEEGMSASAFLGLFDSIPQLHAAYLVAALALAYGLLRYLRIQHALALSVLGVALIELCSVLQLSLLVHWPALYIADVVWMAWHTLSGVVVFAGAWWLYTKFSRPPWTYISALVTFAVIVGFVRQFAMDMILRSTLAY